MGWHARGLAACLLLAAAVPALAERTLIYRLNPGNRLVFEYETTVSDLTTGRTLSRSVDEVQVWCLAQQPEGMLVLFDVTRRGAAGSEPTRAAVFHVDSAGRRRLPPGMPRRLAEIQQALDVMPCLPSDAQSEQEWRTVLDVFGRRWHCHNRGADGRQEGAWRIDFSAEELTGVAELLERQQTGSYWYDPRAGFVTRVTAETEDGRARTRTSVTATFRELVQHSPEWCGRRAAEAERYVQAIGHEDLLLDQIVTRADQWPRIRQQLDQLWAAFKTDVETRANTPFEGLADAQRLALRVADERLAARAALAQRWFGKPAGTWTFQSAAGETMVSESLRGFVVIECYWSAEDAGALRAMEPLHRIQTRLPEQLFRMVGYNVDRDLDRALRAIALGGAGVPQIIAGPLREIEAMPELPIVRVLDRNGIVRGMWFGWDPEYAEVVELACQLADWHPR